MSKLIFILTLSLAAATFANAKDLPVKNIMPDPPSICDAVSGNLLTDCGFESGFTGWVLTGNTVDSFATAGPLLGVVANSGLNFAGLGPVGSDGSLSQTVSTTVGQAYEISWYLQVGSGNPNDFGVSWGGTSIYAGTDLPGTASYARYSFTETATAPTTTLTFSFRDDPAYLFLDDAVVSAVPEPGYFVATGFGLAALLLAKKRRFA
jgi:hypothetical protein